MIDLITQQNLWMALFILAFVNGIRAEDPVDKIFAFLFFLVAVLFPLVLG